jgi:diguanylate cyclase (GGDEF)-like protein
LLGLVPVIVFVLMFVLRKQGVIGVLWCYPAVLSFYFMLPERRAWIANLFLLAVVLPETWSVFEPELAARMLATLLAVSLFSAVFVRVITRQQQELAAQVATDPLTGVLNRMRLRETLEQAIAQNRRTGVAMTLLCLDLDHFKSINDSLGHDAGDTVLSGVGALLLGRARKADRVFRLGGEEFLVFLYGADATSGGHVAEELRAAIESHAFLADRSVTVSIGLAELGPDEGWTAWIKRGDENLYRAKQGGRNRVVA